MHNIGPPTYRQMTKMLQEAEEGNGIRIVPIGDEIEGTFVFSSVYLSL